MSQRPGKDETPEYFFTYIDKVPDADMVATLEKQSGEYAALLDRVSVRAWSCGPLAFDGPGCNGRSCEQRGGDDDTATQYPDL
jgi:hypothetical protein